MNHKAHPRKVEHSPAHHASGILNVLKRKKIEFSIRATKSQLNILNRDVTKINQELDNQRADLHEPSYKAMEELTSRLLDVTDERDEARERLTRLEDELRAVHEEETASV